MSAGVRQSEELREQRPSFTEFPSIGGVVSVVLSSGAVSNYHNLGGLKQDKFILSQL